MIEETAEEEIAEDVGSSPPRTTEESDGEQEDKESSHHHDESVNSSSDVNSKKHDNNDKQDVEVSEKGSSPSNAAETSESAQRLHGQQEEETFCNLTSLEDVSRSLQNISDFMYEANNYITPLANNTRAVFDPWIYWGLDMADQWFVEPFDYRRRSRRENNDSNSSGNRTSEVEMRTVGKVAEEKQEKKEIDMTTICTDIDMTGDRTTEI